MLIDLSTCVGCNACAIACKLENDVPPAFSNTWVESWDTGAYPNIARANVPKQCNHCIDAPCITACQYDATYVDAGGIVVVDFEKCIGCGTCVTACPYGARYVNIETMKCGKCTYCFSRSTSGLLPACVASCITHSRIFGDMMDIESDIAKSAAVNTAESLNPDFNLDTSTRYLHLSDTLTAPVCSEVFSGGH